MYQSVWNSCLQLLQDELPAQQFSMWIRPLQVDSSEDTLTLYAPNRFVLDWVREKYLNRINEILVQICGNDAPKLRFDVGNKPVAKPPETPPASNPPAQPFRQGNGFMENTSKPVEINHKSNIRRTYMFDNFVEGKSNQLAKAAACQVADNPGNSYNPLFIYGGTGLGKTHLLHAVGNGILAKKSDARVIYMHSERFVQDMVKALQNNAIEEFKRYYRSVDALFIDDIQLRFA